MSKIFVDELAGIANANTVAIPGHVIQVVNSLDDTSTIVTSSSFTSTGVSASITPSSSSSRIMIMFNFNLSVDGNDLAHALGAIYRTAPATSEVLQQYMMRDQSGELHATNVTMVAVDSPSTTSACTYELRVRTTGSSEVRVNYLAPTYTDTNASITLMEIAG